jgi:beta-lactamase class A
MRTLLLLLLLAGSAWGQRADKLKKQIQQIIGRSEVGICAVSIVHTRSQERVEIQADQPFPLASVFKVPVMIELARQIQTQQSPLKLSTKLTVQASDKCIGSGSLQHKPAGTPVSLQQLVEWMETRSDNTATDMIFRRIGLASVDRWMQGIGCSSSQIFLTNRAAWLISLAKSSDFKGLKPRQIAAKWEKLDPPARVAAALRAEQENITLSLRDFQRLEDLSASQNTPSENVLVATAVDNKASARDLATVLEKLYLGQLLDSQWTDFCLGVLGRQTFNTRIPRHLPKEVTVYHKTGTIAGVVNDIGVIELGPDSGLVVVVLVQQVEKGDEGRAEGLIAEIARAAYKAYAK